jgi:hypothetical protein
VYFSVASHKPIPACIALAGFCVVDGSAYYWHLKKWRFDSLPILARVHAFLGLMACLMTAAFSDGLNTFRSRPPNTACSRRRQVCS